MGASHKNKNIDNIIDQALLMHESGSSLSEILDTFPEHKDTLREIFDITSLLDEMGDVEIPTAPPSILNSILSENSKKNTLLKKSQTKQTKTIYLTTKLSFAFALAFFVIFTTLYSNNLIPWARTNDPTIRILAIAKAAEAITTSIENEYTSEIEISQSDLDSVVLTSFHSQVDSALDFYITKTP